MTGKLEGGIDLKLVKAGVAADLRFITTSFPLDTTLGWGLTDDERLLVRGDATWDMNLVPLSGDVYIARTRHVQALQRTREHLIAAQTLAARADAALDLLAEELRLAHHALGEITGRWSADALLGEIFGRFCIGK